MVVESSQSLLSPLGSFKPSRGGVCVLGGERRPLPQGPVLHLQAEGLLVEGDAESRC